MIDQLLAEIEVPEEDWLPVVMARGLLRGYHARWSAAQSEIELIGSELTHRSQLPNIHTGRTSRTFTLLGITDKLAADHGLTLYDHKTTSSDIADPDATYWRQLAVESQPSHYALLLGLNGMRIDRIVWDVVRKPGIRPKKLTKSEAAYYGMEREDAALFEARLVDECLENPDRYFQRRGITRTSDEVGEYADELWQIGQELLSTRRHKRWYRNSGACMNYGIPCEYLGICSGHDTEDSDRWKYSDDHEPNVLSDSRVSCFQTCRRKYYYRYELGLARVDEEQREALHFGSLWHQCLGRWWELMSETHHDSCDEKPVSEVGGRADESRFSRGDLDN